jgi:amino acid transporter
VDIFANIRAWARAKIVLMARKHKLKRNLGLFLVTVFALGNIVGAGIYALIGKVAGEAGTATPLAFLIAMLIASFSALSFAELSSSQPYSEGVSAYVNAAFKRKWISVVVGFIMSAATIVSAATLARAFGGYLSAATGFILPIGAIIVIVLFGLLAAVGVEESLKFSAAHTFIEVIGLLVIIWFGRGALGELASKPMMIFDFKSVGLMGVLSGAFLAFYAYIGIEDVVHLSEETKNTRKTMPRAIILSVVISTVLYILISVVSLKYIPAQELKNSAAPLSLVFKTITSTPAWIITLIALTATSGGVLAHILSGSRLLYGMSEAGWLSKKLAVVHKKRKTPIYTILIVVVLSSILAALLDLTFLASATSYLILIVFMLVNVSLLWLKIKKRQFRKSVFKVPIYVPILGVIFCLILLTTQTIDLIGHL